MVRYSLWSATIIVAAFGFAQQVQVQAEPIEYVKVCDTYGTGFFYIPGTNTCMKIEAGADAGLTRSSVELGNIFARTGGGATDTTSSSQSDSAARIGGDLRLYTPLGPTGDNSVFLGGWAAPTLGGSQDFSVGVTYAPGDSIDMRLSYTPNLFTAYGGFERRLSSSKTGDLSAGIYGGARFVKVDMSLSGAAVTTFDVSKSVTRAVPLIGAELTYRITDADCFLYKFFGRMGFQYQDGFTESLSASTAGADVSSTFEVKNSSHFYFQVGRPLF